MSRAEVDTDLAAGVLSNTEWVRRWADGETDFHQSQADPFLDREEGPMFEGKKKSLFLPLCGKTPDIMWMYSRGHTVCGVEIAEQPIKELIEENSIDVEIEHVENVGNLYKSKDGRLKLYVADLFCLTKEMCGQFDIIWDSKSVVAINKVDRQRYKYLMLSLLKPDGKYYLDTIEYDTSLWPGPPHSMPEEVIQDLFGNDLKIELLEEIDFKEMMNKAASEKEEAESNENKPQVKEMSETQAALRSSSYLIHRWYKLTRKT